VAVLAGRVGDLDAEPACGNICDILGGDPDGSGPERSEFVVGVNIFGVVIWVDFELIDLSISIVISVVFGKVLVSEWHCVEGGEVLELVVARKAGPRLSSVFGREPLEPISKRQVVRVEGWQYLWPTSFKTPA